MKTRKQVLCMTLLLALPAAWLHGQVNGIVTTTEGRKLQGAIRWRGVAKIYTITTVGAGNAAIELELPPDQVASIQVPQPTALRPALEAVQAGKGASVIPTLEKIARDYAMLQWDEPAARGLAVAHMQAGNPASAIRACEMVIASKPEAAYAGELATVYWEALQKEGRTAKLNSLLNQAIQKGGREASAHALIRRGDMLMEQNKPREALKDGYLRVIVLYENVVSAQPEALFKAAKAFEALQQNPNAERMRTTLRTKFAASEYARML